MPNGRAPQLCFAVWFTVSTNALSSSASTSVLDSTAACEQPAAAQHPLLAGSLEGDRSFQDRDRYRALGVILFQDGASVPCRQTSSSRARSASGAGF